jgi:hypothetical protein
MRTYLPAVSWVLSRLFLATLAGCIPKGATPPGANASCKTSDNCPSGYQCLAATTGSSGPFCCKDAKSCGVSGDAASSGSGGAREAGTGDGAPQNGGSGGISGGSGGSALTSVNGGSTIGSGGGGGNGGTSTTGSGGGSGGTSAVGSGSGGTSAVGSGSGGSGTMAGGSFVGVGGSAGSAATSGSGGSSGGAKAGSGGSTAVGGAGTGGGAADAATGGPDASTVDAPGTCSVDKDCPVQSPLCLGSKCAKCSTDTDCAGRTGPACAATGLCVGCTANKYCTGVAATCDTATNQCVGCVKRSDCAGSCQTCSSGVCTAVKNQDDPGVCAGTCDATGACKSTQGQICVGATDCAGGLACADGYCCDKACAGSCEACSVAASLGTCTTLLANATPHTGHAACVAANPTCAGKCNGTSSACSYPPSTTSCGTASCTSTSYQAAGTCGNGSCILPAAQTCPLDCVVSAGGCKDCTPSQKQCASGVPQLCLANATWQNQAACTGAATCSGGACVCSKTTCGSSCVDTAADSANCGACGHSCLGGQCVAGQCQPAVVANTPAGAPIVFGVDATYVYFEAADTLGDLNAYRVSKTTVGTSGTLLNVGSSFVNYLGIIGTQLFMDEQGEDSSCTFSADPSLCSTTTALLPGTLSGAGFVPFKSPAPQDFALYTAGQFETDFNWYSTSNAFVHTYADFPPAASSWGYPTQFAFGGTLYWSRYLQDSGGNTFDTSLYSVDMTSSVAKRLTANFAPDPYTIIDANAQSLLLTGPVRGDLYRVALPNGDPVHPPSVLNQSSGSWPVGATEDANAVYWFEFDGTLYSCSAPSCGNKKALASGQSVSGYDLYQDTTALYWGARPGQVMRLVK